jgi:hypothetical protein
MNNSSLLRIRIEKDSDPDRLGRGAGIILNVAIANAQSTLAPAAR